MHQKDVLTGGEKEKWTDKQIDRQAHDQTKR